MHYYRWKIHGEPTFDPPAKPSGPAARNWVGEKVGYAAVHQRARPVLPRECACCEATEVRLEAALLKGVPERFIRYGKRDGSPYSVRDGDYVRLCVKCHRRYDSPLRATSLPIAAVLDEKGWSALPDMD